MKDNKYHIENLNKEMGVVQTDICWIKKKLDNVDARTWWILGTVVVLGMFNIFLKLNGG